ncbi:uncharacterized protein [Acropora muricata]|uniref:uncharacterized protein isoform X4 n=1 Tax=Acropora muricata TaxID=159855 RepID=UPI0034E4AD67
MSQDELCQQASAVQISQGQILNITLLASEWKSTAGGLSTLNRELAIHLSQIQNVRVSLLVPEGACDNEDKEEARSFGISIVDAKKCVGLDPLFWLSNPPHDHKIDVIIGHGVKLGCQVQLIKRHPNFKNCKWVHVVHTAPEDLSKYKGYSDPISKGEKKLWVEVALCKCADLVVPVGPKLRKAYHGYLQESKKDEDFFELIPGLFEREFVDLPAKQNPKDERDDFIVLLCGRGDKEDFEVKGYDVAVKAFADQRLKGKRYSLLFVGSPEGKQDEVQGRLLNCGIDKKQLTVREFVKSREKMKELFCEVDMVIMPSKSEGFGLVALEALSAGLPILVGSNSGFARAIEDIPLGSYSVVDSEDPSKWAECVEGVRERHKVVLRENKMLKEHYSKEYCWKTQCGELVDRLKKMVYGTSAAQAANEVVEQCPTVVIVKPVSLPDPTTIQHLLGESAVTSGSGKERTSGDELTLPELADLLIKLAIKITADLNEEQKKYFYDILMLQTSKFVESRNYSKFKVTGVGALVEFLEKAYDVTRVSLNKGSLIISLNCKTLKGLDQLCNDCLFGHLNKVAERYLVTDEIKTKLNLRKINLKTTIDVENYLNYRRVLLESSAVNDHSTLAKHDNRDGGSENKDSLGINQITEQFGQLRMLRMELVHNFVRWIPIRQRTMEQLKELETKLHEHHRNVNTSTIIGSSMGTAGIALSIAGLIATYFIFGAGLVTILVGAWIGGAVMYGTNVFETILEKLGLKNVQAAIKEDHEACTKLQQQLDFLDDFISKLAQFLKPLHCDATLLRELEGTGCDFLRVRIISNDMGSSTGERVDIGAMFFRTVTAPATIITSAVATAGAIARGAAPAGTRVEHIAGSVIGAALIPLDITVLVKSSLELHRGSTSSAVEEIRQIINDLKCPDVEEIKGLVESFIDEKFIEAYNKMDDETNDDNNIEIQIEEGTSAAQAIATDDLVEQCPSVVTEPVCLRDPTTMQQLTGESAVTSSREKAVNDHSTLAKHDNSDGGSEDKDSLGINQISEKFEQLRMLRMELIDNFVRWIPIRQRTMEQLKELETKLHKHHRNVNISTIIGALMGTVGGALSIAGFIAAPATFGASLIFSLIGAGIGGGGGLVMSGFKVVEIILEKLGLKDDQAAIKEDYEACTKLQQQLDCLEDFISKLAEILKPLNDDAILLRELEGTGFDFLRERIICDDIGSSTGERVDIGAKFFRTVSATATITTSAVATAGSFARSATAVAFARSATAGAIARSAAAGDFARSATAGDFARSTALAGPAALVAGVVICATLIPLDIILLVKSSLELHRGSTSSAVEEIRQIINDLKCPDVEEIKGLVESFIDEKFIEAYNKMDDETNEENYIDVDLEDNSEDKNYEIQIEDSEERRETDRARLWPKRR